MNRAFAFVILPLLTGAASPAIELPLNQDAPDHGLPNFAKSLADSVKVKRSGGVDRAVNGGKLLQADVSDLLGRVLFVHTFDWGDETCTSQTLLLLLDLVSANADREIGVLSIAPDSEELDEVVAAEVYGMNWPLALVKEGDTSPYFNRELYGTNHLFLIGRSGGLRWHGDPHAQEAEMLEAIALELALHSAPALGKPLGEMLAPSLEAYYSGDWGAADSIASKLVKKLGKKKDEASIAAVQDARHLLEVIGTHKADLLERARFTMGKKSASGFLAIRAAVQSGYPRTKLAKEVGEIAKEAVKVMGANSFDDTARWMELHAERPVLFPSRKSKAGDRFAKKIPKFLRKTVNDIPCTQQARYIQEAYQKAR